MDAASQFTSSKHGVVRVLCCIADEVWIVGGLKLTVLDGTIVCMSTEDRTKRLERSFWAEFRVQVVEDGEVVQGVTTGQGEAEGGGVVTEELQVERQVHAEDVSSPVDPRSDVIPVLVWVHYHGAAG